jgi:hypothetical protein
MMVGFGGPAMKSAPLVVITLALAGCGDSAAPQRFSDCRGIAERVALEQVSPESIMAAVGVANEGGRNQEAMLLELEAQRAGFMTVVHEQRIALGLTGANRFAQRYLKAYADCRAIDAGEY